MALTFYEKDFFRSLPAEVSYPAFALVKDRWNDYGFYILYNLFYYKDPENEIEIGNIKILEQGKSDTTLPNQFTQLNDTFCSLGQSLEYYEIIKYNFPDTFELILGALNDIIIKDDIFELFKNEDGYTKGLLRFSTAQKALAEAKILLYEDRILVNENLNFKYSVLVDGASFPHEVYFDFKKKPILAFQNKYFNW